MKLKVPTSDSEEERVVFGRSIGVLRFKGQK